MGQAFLYLCLTDGLQFQRGPSFSQGPTANGGGKGTHSQIYLSPELLIHYNYLFIQPVYAGFLFPYHVPGTLLILGIHQ